MSALYRAPTDMDRYATKFRVMAEFALRVASLSTCKRLQVGAVITDLKFQYVHAIGYNGAPAGRPNDSCTGETGTCGCVHAEMNAILKLRVFDPCFLIVTHSPCPHCSGMILNSPVIHTFFWEPYRIPSSIPHTQIGENIRCDLKTVVDYVKTLMTYQS
jgi:deoxycytidylate deaminase